MKAGCNHVCRESAESVDESAQPQVSYGEGIREAEVRKNCLRVCERLTEILRVY